jgi:DNA polymerase III delta prime subunit
MAPRTRKSSPAKPNNPERGFLTKSQRLALSRLVEIAKLGDHQTSYAGFKVRTHILIYGPSGAGKTEVVHRLARRIGKTESHPVLHISAPGWIVQGAKAEPTTLTVIRSFIRRHDRGVLFLDELDKGLPRSDAAFTESWNVALTGEWLSFLDRSDRLLLAGWTHEDVARLSNYLIVGAGAWQRAHERAEQDGTRHEEQMREDLGIPPEIARRFSSRFIQITEPDKDDFIAALRLL